MKGVSVKMKELFCKKASEVLGGITCERLLDITEVPANKKLGDYAIPCFSLAGEQRRNPAVIAAEFREMPEQNWHFPDCKLSQNVL